MSGRNYERLAIEPFGRQLIETGDLDPIYIALTNMEFDDEAHLHRWLIAYWCFYHAGVACWLSEARGPDFWAAMKTAAANVSPTPTGERWPRGSERRHFRGEASVKAVRTLWGKYLEFPEVMVEYIVGPLENQPVPFGEVSGRAQEHPLFGPWIGFKVADMVDRVLERPVSFDNAAVFMFADPTKAALKLWALKAGLNETAVPKDRDKAINQVVDYLIAHFADLRAPPKGDRPIGLQEVETVLCKWKSHMNGHYPLFNDIDEINEGVLPWRTTCKTAEAFAHAMPTSCR